MVLRSALVCLFQASECLHYDLGELQTQVWSHSTIYVSMPTVHYCPEGLKENLLCLHCTSLQVVLWPIFRQHRSQQKLSSCITADKSSSLYTADNVLEIFELQYMYSAEHVVTESTTDAALRWHAPRYIANDVSSRAPALQTNVDTTVDWYITAATGTTSTTTTVAHQLHGVGAANAKPVHKHDKNT
eukprot:20876-Heterococcus_DN1.PRE.1